MAHQRRGRKALNHDIINVTDLDNEFEEFAVSPDTSHFSSRDTSRTISRESSYNKHRTDMNSVNGTQKTSYKDPFANKNYKDPLKTMAVKDPFKQNSTKHSDSSGLSSNSSLKQEREMKHYSNQRDPARQTIQHSGVMSTQNNLRQMKTLPTREVSTTPLSPNKPVTSIHITKRYNSTPRINKNQKGFGHEEKDIFIDDIEDF